MQWEDFSEYLTHFTKPTPLQSGYDNQLSILEGRELTAQNPFGIARVSAPDYESQKTVCFSEIPLHCLDRLSERRSRYGIGFTKEYAKSKGAQPVWYIEKDTKQHKSIEEVINTALSSKAPESNPIWNLTPFIDIPGDYSAGVYRFEWEREWRCVGNLQFHEIDLAFLIIPEEFHEAARDFFRDARDENIGPFYGCPYIDSSWSLEKITEALETGWPHN